MGEIHKIINNPAVTGYKNDSLIFLILNSFNIIIKGNIIIPLNAGIKEFDRAIGKIAKMSG